MRVYLVWDNSRAEHGEAPVLFDVCASRGVAEMVIIQEVEDDPERNECFTVEPRVVKTTSP